MESSSLRICRWLSSACQTLLGAWPSQIASIPEAAVDIATAQPTLQASFLRIPLAVMILAIVPIRWCPRARRCLTWARQFIRQSRKKPSHRTGLAFMSNFRVTPSQSSLHFLAFAMDGPLGRSEAKNHATSVFSLSIRNPASKRVSRMLSSLVFASCWKSDRPAKLKVQLQSST
jgi:hypothetical protein